MSKRGPLSKIEKFYIENNLSKNVDDLSKDLDRAKSVVIAYVNKCERALPKEKKKTLLSSQIPSSKGATVMTENGSVISDELRNNSVKPRVRPSCIVEVK